MKWRGGGGNFYPRISILYVNEWCNVVVGKISVRWRTDHRTGRTEKKEGKKFAEEESEDEQRSESERLHSTPLLGIVTDKRSVNWGNEAVVIIRLGGNVL